MAKQRRSHSTEFKAQVLAELAGDGATVKGVAARNGLAETVVRRWMRLAGITPPNGRQPTKGRAKTRKPTQFQKDILKMLAGVPAERMGEMLERIATANDVTARQIKMWAKRFGVPTPQEPPAPAVVAAGNGAAANPFLLLQSAREALTAMLAQLDAMQAAFTTLGQVFGGRGA